MEEELEKFEEFFLLWESSCRNFIETFTFATTEAQLSRLRIHVFLRRDTPEKAMPPSQDWITHHYSFTTCPYASDTTIVAYLLERFGHGNDEVEDDTFTIPPSIIYLVTDKSRKYEELIALLKLKNQQLSIMEVNGSERTILDVLNATCKYCKIVFGTQEEYNQHALEKHNFFCENPSCSRNGKRFYNEDELQRHISKQTKCPYCQAGVFCSKSERYTHLKTAHDIVEEIISPRDDSSSYNCQFCPDKKFSSAERKEIHMKNSHKKCNCSCGKYFKSRDEYIEHFYTVYPLPCYENRKCPHRFQSVHYQADHHGKVHFSTHPFFCVPCQQRLSETGYKQRICFKDEKSLRIHGMALGHNEDEMYLTGRNDSLTTDVAVQRRAPSRTCSAINYC